MRSRDLPGHRTERFAAPVGTQELEIDGGVLCDTPGNRSTWWGHRLVLDEPPDRVEPWLDRWRALQGDKGVGRAILSWEHRSRQVPLLPADAEHEALWTLMCDQAVDRVPGPVTVRPSGAEDRLALVELASATEDEPSHMDWAIRGWLARVERGEGELWGGWLDDRLVGVVGLFHDDREARTQWIATHPEHRRRGVCSQLLTHAVFHHQERRAGIVYTVAREDGDGERLYRALGWRRVTAFDTITTKA